MGMFIGSREQIIISLGKKPNIGGSPANLKREGIKDSFIIFRAGNCVDLLLFNIKVENKDNGLIVVEIIKIQEIK